MSDPSGLDGKKMVETGVKGIKLFIEWLPNRNTAEIKILTKKGAELAIAKWIVNPQTGEATCSVVARHGGKVLPGVSQSILRKIMPQLAAEMARNVERIGGTWVLTRLADAAMTGGRLGLGKATVGRAIGAGTKLNAFFIFFALENTCHGAEIERLERFEVDLSAFGLTENEIIQLSNDAEATLPEDYLEWLEKEQERRREFEAYLKNRPSVPKK